MNGSRAISSVFDTHRTQVQKPRQAPESPILNALRQLSPPTPKLSVGCSRMLTSA